MIAIIVKELKLIRKDMRSFFFLLIMPALFIVMFSTIFGSSSGNYNSIDLHVVDQDQTAVSRTFIKQMDGIMNVTTDSVATLDDQVKKIKQGQISSVLVIPRGFTDSMGQGKTADIQLYQDPNAQVVIAPIEAIISEISGHYRDEKVAAVLVAKGETQSQAQAALVSPIKVENISTSSETLTGVDQVVPGMTVMFVFFIMITMSRRFFDEKKTGLLTRIRSTQIKPLQYLMGMWVPFVITVIVQCVILFTFGHLVYGLAMGDMAALGVIVIGLSVAGTGLGLGLSFIVPGESAAMVCTQLISMGGAMLGGLWFPFNLLPSVVQKIGHFTPQYWAQHSLLDVIGYGSHISGIISQVMMLFVFGLVGLAVAWLRLPAFLRSAAN